MPARGRVFFKVWLETLHNIYLSSIFYYAHQFQIFPRNIYCQELCIVLVFMFTENSASSPTSNSLSSLQKSTPAVAIPRTDILPSVCVNY